MEQIPAKAGTREEVRGKKKLTFTPEIFRLLLDVDGIADVDLDLVGVTRNEPVKAAVSRVEQLELGRQQRR